MKKELLMGVATVGIAYELSKWAFSFSTKKEIKQRVLNKYGHLVSEEDGTNGVPMECSHINHDHRSPDYDKASNGRYVTIYQHLNHHVNEAGMNGLTIHNNDWAIDAIEKRIVIWEECQDFDEYYQKTSGRHDTANV